MIDILFFGMPFQVNATGSKNFDSLAIAIFTVHIAMNDRNGLTESLKMSTALWTLQSSVMKFVNKQLYRTLTEHIRSA